jgi:hypothetical protein
VAALFVIRAAARRSHIGSSSDAPRDARVAEGKHHEKLVPASARSLSGRCRQLVGPYRLLWAVRPYLPLLKNGDGEAALGHSRTMPASALVQRVTREHVARLGEPAAQVRFGSDSGTSTRPDLPGYIDILVWKPTDAAWSTTLATAGMCDRPMHGGRHRAEIRWTIRGQLTEGQRSDAAKFLANVAVHPFLERTFYDWNHAVAHPGAVPMFPAAQALLFVRPAATDLSTIDASGTEVRIIDLVPLTRAEHALLQEGRGVRTLFEHFETKKIDPRKPR